jgi:hypothetical protein
MTKTINRTENNQKTESNSFDSVLSNESEAYDIGLRIHNDKIVVPTPTDVQVIGDVFEIAQSSQTLREYIEEQIGSVSNLGEIDAIQESLFDKQWVGEGFTLDYQKTENGDYELIIPTVKENIVIDRFTTRDDLRRAEKLVEGTDVAVEEFYEVFCNHDFIVSKTNKQYEIKRYDSSYSDSIQKYYTTPEYRIDTRRKKARDTGYAGIFIDDAIPDIISIISVIATPVIIGLALFITLMESKSAPAGSLEELYNLVVSLALTTTGAVGIATVMYVIGFALAFCLSGILAIFRQYKHKTQSTSYRPLYKI